MSLGTSGRLVAGLSALALLTLLGCTERARPDSSARLAPASYVATTTQRVPFETTTAPPATATTLPAPTTTPALPEPIPTTSARPKATGTGTWAVVVGVNDYAGTAEDLSGAVNDAAAMSAVLDRMGTPPGQRLVLTDHAATGQAVLDAVDWLVANAGPDSLAVVFFAGHIGRSGTRHALLGHDWREIDDRLLATHLSDLVARRTWIVLAGCYSGGFDEMLAPGRVLTAASSPTQESFESRDYRRSYLGEYLLHRALGPGATSATVASAFEVAQGALLNEHPDRLLYQLDRSDGITLFPDDPGKT